ncbi:hypothetical protein NDU88_002925 [Pleurodeles waltl]|uniref:Secreted protein n=1 Tax=Pleurodeles waltl TaxID=8319 RepID=A0AAV7VCJ9_PLEWA|nr:hypothetical protein NDU88_002925 [Pleurodeles waltl]
MLPAVVLSALERSPVTVEWLCEVPEYATAPKKKKEIICCVLYVVLNATARHCVPNQYRVLPAVVLSALEHSPVTVERLC